MSLNTADKAGGCALPDITNEPHLGPNAKLNWVGMSNIELPVFMVNGHNEKLQTISRVQAYVNLTDPDSKGIHMSRLYLTLDQKLGMSVLTPALMQDIVADFVGSHEGISDHAFLECRLDFFERRDSLISNNTGWKSYPFKLLTSLKKGDLCTEVTLDIPYSSTCPCSAALSRQLIQKGFEKQFGENGNVDIKEVHDWLGTPEGISATPHSQRSVAQVRIKLDNKLEELPVSHIIDVVESALQTPVQAAVKREDEQEFARLNAANLMFCEDAARRIYAKLNSDDTFKDFWVRVNHLESLHPHDAVAIVTKGIEGGYDDAPQAFSGNY
ncbi:MAG: GTP cyclohydrolase I (EC type 2 [uncultured Thiotrichaceae bacterium]|uniref:GTP cyclohydrolase FolE2 n=1 Tax=uncultured Thiotrichaceae bacterium TaxID=298394 RepID=A0A6S6TG02_9GAMM|nr:MAG: GTP cyclohydrolase I (EC type 2 [uncultured Thiotrichaceae bacterium]